MEKKILKYAAAFGLGIMALAGCTDKEAELLVPKLYFEASESTIQLDEEKEYTVDLQVRLSSMTESDVAVSYSIAGEDVVDAYNKKYGKEYKVLSTASLSSETSSIRAGEIVSDVVELKMTGLDLLGGGDNYLLPVRVHTGDVPVIEGSDITYYVVKKPAKIMKAARFNNSYIKVPITPLDVFKNVTYEAVINVSNFGDNNTVMGCEGVMIMRIGDAGGGTVPRDILQIAGKSEITWTDNPLKIGQWYHLAFTCSEDGKANLYVNGENVINSSSFTMSSDLTAGGADYGFSIGMVPRFMWGTRPFNGYMSEVRLWNVVRTANQIKENMLGVDPDSDGLVAYYKLDGTVEDASGNGMEPEDMSAPSFVDLDNPIAIGGGL